MKNNPTRLAIIFLSFIIVAGCENHPANKTGKEQDSPKIKEATIAGKSVFGGRPVPANLANECIDAYYQKLKTLDGWDTVTSNPKLTMSVGFEFPGLQYWMANLSSNPDELKVCFGVYTKNYIDSLVPEHPELIGRLTVFLWPYKSGMPIDQYYQNILKKPLRDGNGQPYNVGELKP
jgi:hypothetical protein